MAKFSDILKSKKIVLLDFSAEWCGPCKMQAPILKEVKDKIGDEVTILKVDVDKNSELAGLYQIRSVPTLLIFKNGELKWKESGVKQTQELIQLLNQYS